MADLKYVVDVDLNVDSGGATTAKIGKIKDSFGPLANEINKIGGSLLGSFEGVVEKTADLVVTAGKIGAAGAVAGITWGLTLNKSLEDTKISLAAILNAAGQAGDIKSGMGAASDLMSQMRKDAAVLPGTFEDLVGIFRTISTSGFNVGMDVEGVKKMSETAMATGAVMGLRSDVVGRELAMLLEGRAGAHNILGARMGLMGAEAKKFNAESPEKRAKEVGDRLAKYAPAIAEFGTSFSAVSTTLLTNVRKFATDATGPLFERIKGAIGDINAWFDNNQATVKLYSDKIGIFLEKAFDRGKEVVLEYGPLLMDWGGRAYDKIVRIWQDAEPFVKSIGNEIKEFLSDDKGFDKIATILKLYIAAKGIGAMGSVASTLSPLISAGVGLIGGGGAGAAGGVGAIGAVGAAGGEAALALGTGGAGATAGATAPIIAIAAAIGATIYEVITRQSAVRTVDHSGDTGFRSKENQRYIDDLGEKGKAAARSIADMDESTYAAALDLPPGFSAAADAAQEFAATMRSLSKSGDFDKVGAMAMEALDAEDRIRQAREADLRRTEDFHESSAAVGILAMNNLAAAKLAEKKAKDARAGAGRGSGGTTIHKVEISVSTNQNPGQVARQVGAYLSHASRFRTSSPYTRSFTTPGLT